MSIRMIVEIDPPTPDQSSQYPCAPSVEDQVQHALELIDSGKKSDVEWIMINKMYRELRSRKPTPRIQNLIDMIEPVIAKFGYHGTPSDGK